MADDFYTLENFDFKRTKGDTINIKLRLFDELKQAVDIIGWESKWNIKDPITNQVIVTLEKTHDDTQIGGDGIYYNGDTQQPVGLGITNNNELVVVLSYNDTFDLAANIYPFDIEFTIDGAYLSKFTLHGNLILVEDITPSA